MSISCWRSLSSQSLMASSTILKEFYEHTFHPLGIISTLPIEIWEKTISFEVEVFDAPIDYNFLLGRPWFYEMKEVASFVLCVLHFPHQRKIVTINQLN